MSSVSPAIDGPRRSVVREALLIGLLALTLNLVGNGRTSLWDRDEPRYAGATREMRESGDWIHPTFNAEPRYHKPILIYWLMLAGTALGGDGPFGVRLVSAVMGVGTVLLTWGWSRRVLGERTGRLAGLVLATMPLMMAESKLSTTDATLAFFYIGCQIALWELWARPSRGAAATFWTMMGLAVLTKSPAAPVLLVASVGFGWLCGGPSPFLYHRRLQWRWGLPLFLAIVVPWNVAILIRSAGEYFNVAVGYHIVQRATQGIEEHGGFPGYYVVVGMATLLPWAALIPAAVASAWSRRRETAAAGFLIGWAIGPLILLECVRTKLIHYYLPAVPALAVLVAWLLVRVLESPTELPFVKLFRFARRTIAVSAAVIAMGLAIGAVMVLPGPMRAPALTAGVLAAAGGWFVLHESAAGRLSRAILGTVAFTAAMELVLAGWCLPAAEPFRSSSVVGRRLAALEDVTGAKPALCTFRPPGTVYALGHPAPIIRSRGEFLDHTGRAGALLMPLTAGELEMLRKDSTFEVEIHETVEGLNIEKLRNETLHLSTVRLLGEPTPAIARPESGALIR
ncbi:ArnT family glycosyltransferase [Paludisphaera rhizosphaerae]|uniref:ArnT family glycosyltransferase n=1 Tax=Paludisphaera rhizosphaerae TaxID=2711216 RepID=UPI0013EA2F6A|nr:glycosyltransferase family 39 protein [Paludisphaera rhizosphaerae]